MIAADFSDEHTEKITRNQRLALVNAGGEIVPSRLVGGKLFNHKNLREHLISNKLRSLRKFFDDYDQFPHLRDEHGIVSAKYAHEPIITPEQAQMIDEILDKNSKHSNKSDDHLLSGILYSADNETYKGTSSLKQTSSGAKKYLYYDSPTAFQNIILHPTLGLNS